MLEEQQERLLTPISALSYQAGSGHTVPEDYQDGNKEVMLSMPYRPHGAEWFPDEIGVSNITSLRVLIMLGTDWSFIIRRVGIRFHYVSPNGSCNRPLCTRSSELSLGGLFRLHGDHISVCCSRTSRLYCLGLLCLSIGIGKMRISCGFIKILLLMLVDGQCARGMCSSNTGMNYFQVILSS